MYERMLLESGKVFRGRRVSGVGADAVVDEEQTITIPVFIPEGKAHIVNVDYPSTFTPGVAFDITVTVKNDGNYGDELFVNIDNITPGYESNIASMLQHIAAGASKDFIIPVGGVVPLPQEIDLIALIQAGHYEGQW